uniref:Uncharacterized protein n=1 Tax=Cacopsylla melanoneura TaxID=428564 RepID=A0A8D8RQU4_9HEMI
MCRHPQHLEFLRDRRILFLLIASSHSDFTTHLNPPGILLSLFSFLYHSLLSRYCTLKKVQYRSGGTVTVRMFELPLFITSFFPTSRVHMPLLFHTRFPWFQLQTVKLHATGNEILVFVDLPNTRLLSSGPWSATCLTYIT